MDCAANRPLLLAFSRGHLPAADHAHLSSHLVGCPGCRATLDAERALDQALDLAFPRQAAPAGLVRRLRAGWPEPSVEPLPRHRPRPRLLAAAALAAVALVVLGFWLAEARRVDALADEAVARHLALLGGEALAQVSGGLHEVRPAFNGKLPFSPAVTFAGDEDFPLLGGAVEPFGGGRAAVFVYGRRLHKAALYVVETGAGLELGGGRRTVHGFNVRTWRSADQRFLLVSDLNPTELEVLAQRLGAGGP